MKIAVAGGTGTVGRHVVEAIAAQGHQTVVLSRAAGVDLMRGEGLVGLLAGVDVVIDVTSTPTALAADSVRFFGTVTANLLQAESLAGVGHHVVLSIIGAAKINAAYYAGKKVQEDLVMGGAIPWSLVRAAQFHEFVTQLIDRGKVGPIQVAPTMRSQPIAAVEVAAALVGIATGEPQQLTADLAGPKVENMADLVRRYLRAVGVSRPVLQVPFPGSFGRGMRDGSLLAGPNARLGSVTFDEWLAAGGR